MGVCGLALYTTNEIYPRSFDTQIAYWNACSYRAAAPLTKECRDRAGLRYAFLIARSAIRSPRQVVVIARGGDTCS